MKKLIGLSIVIAVFFSACKKKDDDSSDTPMLKTKTELLIGTWLKISEKPNPPLEINPGEFITDFMDSYDDCMKDNLIVFEAGNKGHLDEGPMKCDSSDFQLIDFEWDFFDPAQTQVYMYFENTSDNIIEITTLTENELISHITDPNDPNYTITTTYIHP